MYGSSQDSLRDLTGSMHKDLNDQNGVPLQP